jgi:hypothetical protein
MTEDVTILDEARRRMESFWRWVLALGLPSVVGAFASLFPLMERETRPAAVAGLLLSLAGFTVFYVRARKVANNSAVLWIRRFGQGQRSRRLYGYLQFAVIGSGSLITLGDDDVLYEPVWLDLVIAVAALIAVPALGMPWIAAVVSAVFLIVDRRYKNHRQRTRFLTREKLLRKLHRALRSAWRFQGADSVFLCHGDEETWLHAIDFLAERVDAVVISADESTGAVREELRRLLAAGRVKPCSVVLLLSEPSHTAAVGPFPELAGAWRFHLPARLSWWPYNRTARTLAVTIKAAVLSRDPALAGGDTEARTTFSQGPPARPAV